MEISSRAAVVERVKSKLVLVDYRMSSWKRKKYEHGGKRSVTPGKKKGPTCQTDSLKSFMAKKGRSYKHPLYGSWCAKMDAYNR